MNISIPSGTSREDLDTSIATPLLSWYDQYGRKSLPWRTQITPYRVWISEVMLQQTQVKTVLPYFARFIHKFDKIASLADAPLDSVLSLWTGLGYYARGRNLHKAAQQMVTLHAGRMPDDITTLLTLPGIGKSTAGAIAAIAFGKKAAILDGNVKRILTRLYQLSPQTTHAQFSKALWKIAALCTPEHRPGDYAQAIMDLGATVCTRTKPKCRICPLQMTCKAYASGQQLKFPVRMASKKRPVRNTYFIIVYNRKQKTALLEKRPPSGIWGGLLSFPECTSKAEIPEFCEDVLHISAKTFRTAPKIKHNFTHFQLNITPVYIDSYTYLQKVAAPRFIWYGAHMPTEYGLCKPAKYLLYPDYLTP